MRSGSLKLFLSIFDDRKTTFNFARNVLEKFFSAICSVVVNHFSDMYVVGIISLQLILALIGFSKISFLLLRTTTTLWLEAFCYFMCKPYIPVLANGLLVFAKINKES